MLDNLPLSEKLAVAREWFRRSRTGEFQFTTRHADTFEKLLEACHVDAVAAEIGPAGTDNVVRLLDERGSRR